MLLNSATFHLSLSNCLGATQIHVTNQLLFQTSNIKATHPPAFRREALDTCHVQLSGALRKEEGYSRRPRAGKQNSAPSRKKTTTCWYDGGRGELHCTTPIFFRLKQRPPRQQRHPHLVPSLLRFIISQGEGISQHFASEHAHTRYRPYLATIAIALSFIPTSSLLAIIVPRKERNFFPNHITKPSVFSQLPLTSE